MQWALTGPPGERLAWQPTTTCRPVGLWALAIYPGNNPLAALMMTCPA